MEQSKVAASIIGAVLVLTTQNVKVTLPPDKAAHDIRQAAQYSSVVFTQEMFYRDAGRFAPAGWGSAHHPGRNRGDCATYWDRDVWQRLAAFLVPITWATFKHGHRWALVTVLRGHGVTVAAVCVHLITRFRFHPIATRNGTRRLAALTARLRDRWGRVVIGGDWNRPFSRRPDFPGFRSGWPPRGTGPRGGRPDYVLTTRPVEAVHVVGHTWSDHNGVRYRLGIR